MAQTLPKPFTNVQIPESYTWEILGNGHGRSRTAKPLDCAEFRLDGNDNSPNKRFPTNHGNGFVTYAHCVRNKLLRIPPSPTKIKSRHKGLNQTTENNLVFRGMGSGSVFRFAEMGSKRESFPARWFLWGLPELQPQKDD